MARDISKDALNVGNALASVRIDQMILNLAKGIAWGQYELDKVGVDITKMMGVPGVVSIGGEKISMLEAGFLPSFYHFVDTILELKMEVNIREEELKSTTRKSTESGSTSFGISAEMGTKASGSAGYGPFSGSAEMSFKMGMEFKTESAYARSVDTSHAQKFSQDLNATSLMRTKLVPVPPPEILVERIRILLDKLRKNAEDKEKELILFALPASFAGILDKESNASDEEIAGLIEEYANGLSIESSTISILKSNIKVIDPGNSWTLIATIDGTDTDYYNERDKTTDNLKVFAGKPEEIEGSEKSLMDGIEKELLEFKEETGG